MSRRGLSVKNNWRINGDECKHNRVKYLIGRVVWLSPRHYSLVNNVRGGGREYSLVNSVRGDRIHGGTEFTPTPGY